ncbi:MAG TPA: hypothetical protein P5141_08480, partial [Candidatus Hydrogenedentes bacterium]|nr:hypothetical protein [Candidatus Hydrogenedentota bacterium]
SRSLEAFDRARLKGKFPGEDLAGRVERIRAVHSFAPRSDLGKRLGLMTKVDRGELAALLIQELRLDRLREHLEADAGTRVTDLHVWEVGPGRRAAAVSLAAAVPRPAAHYHALIPPELGIVHATIEVLAAGQ